MRQPSLSSPGISLERETTKMRFRATGTLLMQSVEQAREIAGRMLQQADWDEAAARAMLDRAEALDDLDEVEALSGGPVAMRQGEAA
jgi:hypothetical protein